MAVCLQANKPLPWAISSGPAWAGFTSPVHCLLLFIIIGLTYFWAHSPLPATMEALSPLLALTVPCVKALFSLDIFSRETEVEIVVQNTIWACSKDSRRDSFCDVAEEAFFLKSTRLRVVLSIFPSAPERLFLWRTTAVWNFCVCLWLSTALELRKKPLTVEA